MNLIFFLTVGVLFSLVFGEFGQFPFGSTNSFSITDILLCITLACLLIWQFGIEKKIIFPKQFFWILAFCGIGLLSLILSGNYSGLLYLVRFLIYSSCVFLGFSLAKFRDKRDILKVISLVGFIVSLLGFGQLVIFPDLKILSDYGYDPHINRLFSTFLDPNFVGTFLNITLITSLYLLLSQKSKLFLLIFGVIFLAVILTFSRSAYLMLFIEIFIFGVLKKRILIGLLIVAVFLGYLFVPQFSQRIQSFTKLDQSSIERFESWQKGIQIFQQNPIIGVGFNNLRDVFEKNNLFKTFSPEGGNSGAGVDSSVIFILATTGVLGGLFFLFFYIFILKELVLGIIKKDAFSVLLISIIVGMFVNSQFINSMFYPPLMVVTFLLIGMGLGREKRL